MLGELGGDMEDDYSLPQDVEEVYIPSTKDEELGGLFASTMQIAAHRHGCLPRRVPSARPSHHLQDCCAVVAPRFDLPQG